KKEKNRPDINILTAKRGEIIKPVLDKFSIHSRPLVGIAPGASFGPAKRWPAAYYRELATRLIAEYKAAVILTGSAADAELAKEIPGLNLCGRTSLEEAVALIAGCDLFISNDSGPMHIAAALNIPQIAVFGSTDPVRTGPFNNKAVIMRHKGLQCSPCRKSVCPYQNYACLYRISVEQVFTACKKYLK
ncbi:MAG TPA: lipopolysaccharide heptosyltransferase II, partial [Spirochaetota bacterium]|nr:lipopolysaccharide heptosyltransferase II [Spirochaetota bacterium]